MLEKGFAQLVEETLTVKPDYTSRRDVPVRAGHGAGRLRRFSRLHHLRFLSGADADGHSERCLAAATVYFGGFWHAASGGAATAGGAAAHARGVGRRPRPIDEVTLDTDTTVHTLFGNQMGGRKSYNPKNKGRRATSRS
jgi:hypothetical protein